MTPEDGQDPARRQETATPPKQASQHAGPRIAGSANAPRATFLPPSAEARLVPHELRRSSGARTNPADFSISLRNRLGSDQQLHRPGPRKQSLPGFEDHYVDIVDYIVRATHRVWEEHDVGYVYDIYRQNAIKVTQMSSTTIECP